MSMNGTTEERLAAWNSNEAKKYIVHDIFLLAYFIIGFVGNVFVLIIYKIKLKNENESKYFIPVLAFVDLFACGLRVAFELWRNLLPVNFQDIVGCKIIWTSVNFFGFSSIFLLAVITLQRYLKVCRPFGTQMTLKWRRMSLVFTSILSSIVSCPFIIWNEKLDIPNPAYNVTGHICGANILRVDDSSNSFLSFVLFVSIVIGVVMLELTVLNTLIGKQIINVVKNQKKRKDETRVARTLDRASKVNLDKIESISETSSRQTSRETLDTNLVELSIISGVSEHGYLDQNKCLPPLSNQTETITKGSQDQPSSNFSYLIMVISLAFVISYIPQVYLLFSLILDRYFWIKSSVVEVIVYRFIEQLVTVNYIVNPFVYGFFDRKFRNAFKDILCYCCK